MAIIILKFCSLQDRGLSERATAKQVYIRWFRLGCVRLGIERHELYFCGRSSRHPADKRGVRKELSPSRRLTISALRTERPVALQRRPFLQVAVSSVQRFSLLRPSLPAPPYLLRKI